MENKAYRMPQAFVGTEVLYYPDGDTKADPQFARIVEVGGLSVMLKVTVKSSGPDRLVPAAIHITDPRMNNPEIRKDGAWDFHPTHYATEKMLERIRALEKHSFTKARD